ncbi:MAG TPA: 4Fe-4S cluster-binding domain-containing protein, partial [Candidatus Goldiibacteriota bacterium]|nr:4Fe-4S cluster-binding domain-containing protein [Candidatus Goldiibacteriota bacterium]
MEPAEKLLILGESAKYDVSCSSSGTDRAGIKGGIGSAAKAGICHTFTADGRCISLLKVLLTNNCIYDCAYCINRKSNDIKRAAFTPQELADITINFYKRNYIEGLFLSSGVVKNADFTMELMVRAVRILRQDHLFNGYIHIKAIPGASQEVLDEAGLLADRLSINMELPSD